MQGAPRHIFFPRMPSYPGRCPGHPTGAVVLTNPCQAGPGVSKGITVPGLRKHAKLFVDEVFFISPIYHAVYEHSLR